LLHVILFEVALRSVILMNVVASLKALLIYITMAREAAATELERPLNEIACQFLL
jgi:hypothetical protein